MCGILCVLGKRAQLITDTLKHRGPDASRVVTVGNCTMEFSRLAINDLSEGGMQPFIGQDNKSALVCNGEIYNHQTFSKAAPGASDCACLIDLIEQRDIAGASASILGEFALCYTDGERVLASRDPLGVRPLFYTRFKADDGQPGIAFASEVKALVDFPNRVDIFPPGHVYDSSVDLFTCYYPCYWDITKTVTEPSEIKTQLNAAVTRRVMNTERSMGFLLSGGLDSSLVVAIAKRCLPDGQRLRTFSIGTSPDSPDCKAARIVSEHLGTDHTEVIFTVDEGLAVIDDVIATLESYDTTTVRASVPMWLLARWISKNTDCKVILSGEGSDELFGGYLYFHGAPSVRDLSKECGRRLRLIHQFDGLRADRCMSAHGLELRVPFLDREVVAVGMTVDQSLKSSKPEKRILREQYQGYLPDEILWRQKNGMSDAVGYNWVDAVKEHCQALLSDEEHWMIRHNSGGHNVPQTKEESFYRELFWETFGHKNDHLISEIWRPRWTDVKDPSARQLQVFEE
jgi:asparagine synthase (glutamine-hydrolysing)